MSNQPTISLRNPLQPLLSIVKTNSLFITNAGDGSLWESSSQNWEGVWLWGGGETVTNNDTPTINLR